MALLGVLAFDTETHCFRPGNQAPPVVCVSWSIYGRADLLAVSGSRSLRGQEFRGGEFWTPDGPRPARTPIASWLAHALSSGLLLVGAHVAYDLAVLCAHVPDALPAVFRAYEQDRVTDVLIRQKLADIGRGVFRGQFRGSTYVPTNYDLETVARRHGATKRKDDPWRTRYEELQEIPLAAWAHYRASDGLLGSDAIAYSLGDATGTEQAYLGQGRYDPALLVDEYDQARKFWGLQLASVWGIRTSAHGVDQLELGVRTERDRLGALLREVGLVRADGSRDTKLAKLRMIAACGAGVRRTEKGAVCLDSDACSESGDELLESYAEYSSFAKVLANDVQMLRGGTEYPIHTRWGTAKTSRVTSSKPNIQNPRRLPGVRECFVPRGGE